MPGQNQRFLGEGDFQWLELLFFVVGKNRDPTNFVQHQNPIMESERAREREEREREKREREREKRERERKREKKKKEKNPTIEISFWCQTGLAFTIFFRGFSTFFIAFKEVVILGQRGEFGSHHHLDAIIIVSPTLADVPNPSLIPLSRHRAAVGRSLWRASLSMWSNPHTQTSRSHFFVFLGVYSGGQRGHTGEKKLRFKGFLVDKNWIYSRLKQSE